MTLPETKIGLELTSGVPGVRVEGVLREGVPAEFVEPPRCAVAADPSKPIINMVQVTKLRKRNAIPASIKSHKRSGATPASETQSDN
jgi:hypothetical protein